MLSSVFLVTLSGPPFRGFILQAKKYQAVGNVGTFKDAVAGGELKKCQRNNDTVIGWFDKPQQNLTYTWLAPEDDLGTVHFV